MRGALLLVLLLLGPSLATAQAAEEPSPTERALGWLAARAPAQRGYHTNVVEALAAAGIDPKAWPRTDESEWSLLGPYGSDETTRYYSYQRVAHAAGVAGYDPRDVHGVDYVAKVRAGFAAGQSGDPTFVNDDVWAILALRAAGVPADDEQIRAAVRTIRATQLPTGGWAYTFPATRGSTDVTGMALAALRAAGEPMGDFATARAFLDGTYNATDGSHSDGDRILRNCQSTVWALHGYHALGVAERPASLAFLRGLQTDAGGVRTSPSAPEDPFCTAEWIVAMAGARYPLPSYQATTPREPECHALEPVTLSVGSAFTRLDVTWDDGVAGATRTFDSAGERGYRWHASGPGITARGEGSLTVLSARPVVPEFPDISVPHRAPILLDLSGARDPDGTVSLVEIDWGDGNVTGDAAHAYARPGEFVVRVRAKDDAGVWSAPRAFHASIYNRAPIVTLPARVVADRIAGVDLAPQVLDPEGDAVTLSWRAGTMQGEGAPRFVPTALGNRTLEVTARDAFGMSTTATTTVEVVNTPPTLRLVERDGEVVAEAADPDGDAPTVAWLVDGEPAVPPIRAHRGVTRVLATATDADGASATATLSIAVDAAEPVEPTIVTFDASLAEGALDVRFELAPAGATARLVWRSDAGEGEAVATSPFYLALPGATWANVVLVAQHDGLEATRASGLLVPPAPETPPTAPPTPAPTPIVVTPSPLPIVAPPAEVVEAPLEPASLTEQSAARRETPGPPLALAFALVLVLASARRGTRAR